MEHLYRGTDNGPKTVSQKYLLKDGIVFSPVTSAESVYHDSGLNALQYMANGEHLVYGYIQSSSSTYTFNSYFFPVSPSSDVLYNNTAYGTPSSSYWTCKIPGYYTISAITRPSDVSSGSSSNDTGIRFNVVDGSQNIAIGMARTKRITVTGTQNIYLNEGDKLQMCIWCASSGSFTSVLVLHIIYLGKDFITN
jgi:hypothetical protein